MSSMQKPQWLPMTTSALQTALVSAEKGVRAMATMKMSMTSPSEAGMNSFTKRIDCLGKNTARRRRSARASRSVPTGTITETAPNRSG